MENKPSYHIKPRICRAPWQRMEAAPLHLWHWCWAAPGASTLALPFLLSSIFPVLDKRQTVLHAMFSLKLSPYNTSALHLLIELVLAGSDRKLQPSENSPMPTDQDLLKSSCFRPSVIKSCSERHSEHRLKTHHAKSSPNWNWMWSQTQQHISVWSASLWGGCAPPFCLCDSFLSITPYEEL